MPTFEITTLRGEKFTIKSRSFLSARSDARRWMKHGDSIDGITTIKTPAPELPRGHEIVRQVCLANEPITERMNEVEASYIRYWTTKREYWMAKTEKEIDEIFPNRYNSYDYYRSEYYKLRNEGGLAIDPRRYEIWLEKVRKDALKAKEQSINNLVHAIVKIARNEPITFFKVYNIKRGKAGLEGMVQINETTKRLFAIYAEGPIQRLHIRYLIK